MGREKVTRKRPSRDFSGNKSPTLQYYRSAKTVEKRDIQAPRRPEARREPVRVGQFFKHLPTYISIIVIAVSLVYCSIIGNNAAIVVPPGASLYPLLYYQDQATVVLKQSAFNHSKFTFDTEAFKTNLQARIPDATDITVSLPFIGKKPVVGLNLAKPLFLLNAPTGTYVVGDNGIVLADAHNLDAAKSKDLTLLQEELPIKITVGKAIMSSSDIAFILTVITQLDRAKLASSTLILPAGANELYVKFTSLPYLVKFALTGEARQQVGAFLAVKNGLGANVPSEYIDVRVAERVYVK